MQFDDISARFTIAQSRRSSARPFAFVFQRMHKKNAHKLAAIITSNFTSTSSYEFGLKISV